MGKGRKTTAKTGQGRKAKKEPGCVEDDSTVKTKPNVKYRYPVPGLSNLGNTCFFNAVLQNISQSHHFRSRLTRSLGTLSYNLDLTLPESKVPRSLSVTAPHGALTKALGQLLDQMSTQAGGTVHPGIVFSEVCKQAPRFKGYEQQDSQELLRYLLDSLRTEETKRIKQAVLSSFNVPSKMKDNALTENDRKDIKAYGHLAGMAPTFVDEVFAGQLMSTVECKTCQYRSDLCEDFMDLCLSVPVNEALSNPAHVSRRKNQREGAEVRKEDSEPTLSTKAVATKSKHQQKKDRQQQRKVEKRKPNRQHPGAHGGTSMATEEMEQTADKEINAVVTATVGEHVTPVAGMEDVTYCISSGETSENTRHTGGPISTGDAPPTGGLISTGDAPPTGATTNSSLVAAGSPTPCVGDSTMVQADHQGNLPTGAMKDDEVTLKLSSVSLSNVDAEPAGEASCAEGSGQPSAEGNDATPNDHTLVACLRRFCSLELLAGENKFACPGCYARSSGPSNAPSNPGGPSNSPSKPSGPSNSPSNPSGPSNSGPLSSGLSNHDHLSNSCTCFYLDPLPCEREHPGPDYSNTFIQLPNMVSNGDATVVVTSSKPSSLKDGGGATSDPLSMVEGTGEEGVTRDNDGAQPLLPDRTGEEGTTEDKDGDDDPSMSSDVEGGTIDQSDPLGDKVTCNKRSVADSTVSSEGEEEGDGGMLSTQVLVKRKVVPTEKKRDVVYSSLATKQMLVSRPPLVLVFCFKRFIHQGKSLRKNNVYVSFPLLLDLSPFCTQNCQSQYGRIQYSLYGLVEHAGGMHGGHYVAYINARRPDSGEVHPSPQQDSASSPPLLLPQRTGDWYYMSGTHVRPATEGEVLKSQAYLLFYERMS